MLQIAAGCAGHIPVNTLGAMADEAAGTIHIASPAEAHELPGLVELQPISMRLAAGPAAAMRS